MLICVSKRGLRWLPHTILKPHCMPYSIISCCIVQCGAVIKWSIFFKILIIDIPYLAFKGEVWDVCCEFEVWFMNGKYFCSGIGEFIRIYFIPCPLLTNNPSIGMPLGFLVGHNMAKYLYSQYSLKLKPFKLQFYYVNKFLVIHSFPDSA